MYWRVVKPYRFRTNASSVDFMWKKWQPNRETVRPISEIGHLAGKQTIAESAENAAIIQRLTSLGVDYAQGYGRRSLGGW